jgi:Bacterial DNA polymerase III alpha NTPase domain
MNYDQYGQVYTDSNELCNLLYRNPKLDISLFQVTDSLEYNRSVAELHAELDLLGSYRNIDISIEEFDATLQKNWHMPKEYKDLDIAAYVLGLCREDHELQRVGQELLLYQERELFDLLRYLKYLVDTLRKNNIVWGVGRGSSVASYVLFLLGIHKIDRYYNLNIDEFLK